VAQACTKWRETHRQLDELQRAAADRDSRIDYLDYQVRELQALDPRADEIAQLDAQHALLANTGRMQHVTQSILQRLSEDEQHAVTAGLGTCLQELGQIEGMDERLAAISEALRGALIQLEDSGHELRAYLDRLEADPARLEEIEQRLGALHDVARKHHVEVNELPALLDTLQRELDELRGAETRLDGLHRQLESLHAGYHELATQLSDKRAQAAHTLASRVTGHMQELGMPGGLLEIRLAPLQQTDPSSAGLERVEFLVSTNPGQPVKSLAKVASGGELSRISLAIQMASANVSRIPTLVFDEVDVGIGGGVAEIVGRMLRSLGDASQVMCVTHLAQVAAQAHQHLQVSKSAGDGATNTRVRVLDSDARRDEIARMLGGVEITDQSRAHAQEMIERARQQDSEGKPAPARRRKNSA
jgi:DNA repair protein RecN (Recombination protein N)